MLNLLYREATKQDIPFLAAIRAKDWESEEYWNKRISDYLDGASNPQHALKPRMIYVVSENDKIVGFAAGHLTRRYGCDGEVEWIDVIEEYRRNGIASELARRLAKWFVEQKAHNICIDPGNEDARQFYRKNGAEALNEHWMVWRDIRTILRNQ